MNDARPPGRRHHGRRFRGPRPQPTGPLSLEQRCVRQFPKPSLARGRQYFSHGRVSDPVWDGPKCSLFVHGQGGNYQVSFDFSRVTEFNELLANCECPAFARGPLCKHLWAAVLQTEKSGPKENIPPSETLKIHRGSFSAPRIRGPVAPWLGRLNQLQGKVTQEDVRSLIGPSASFVVQATDTAASGKLVMDLWVRTRSPRGDLGPLRPQRMSRDGLTEYGEVLDQEILSTLLRTSNPNSGKATTRFTLDSVIEGHVVPLLANAGKLFLSRSSNGSPDSADRPLRMDRGATWNLELRLSVDGRDYYILEGRLRRGDETRSLSTPVAILRGGFLLFEDRIGRFADPAHAPWAIGLRGPEFLIPKTQGDDFLTKILLDPNSPPITWPENLGWSMKNIEPKPKGVFRPLGNNPSLGRMTLTVSFDYEGHEIPLSDLEESFVVGEKKTVYKRNQEFEERTLVDALRILRDPQGTGSVQTNDLTRAAGEFVQNGWTIYIENKKLLEPRDFSLNISSNTDWFDLDVEIDFGNLTISRADLLAALQAKQGVVRLSDGSLGILPTEWASQYSNLSEFGEMTKDGNIRFNKSQGLMLNAMLGESTHVRADSGFQLFRDKIAKFEGVTTVEAPAGFKGDLRNYQKEGLTWLQFLGEFQTGGILADDMGLGKTIQVLAFLLSRKSNKPHLVVTPKSLAFNWYDEAKKFAPSLKVIRYAGVGRNLKAIEEADVVVTTYGTLRADIEKLKNVTFDVAIVDEAQAIKNAKSLAAVSTKQIKANLRIALTGTPIENSINDLLSILDYTNPGLLGSTEIKGDTQAALVKVLKPFMLRRTKEKVLTELPDRSEQVLYCEMSATERQYYVAIRERYKASLEEKVAQDGLGKSKLHVLEALLRLRQAACHSGLIDPKRASEPSAKIEQLIQHMQEVISEGHKVLVFSQFTSLLSLVRTRLEEEGIIYEYLDGQTDDRKTPVDRFQKDPLISAFLISLKAGGTGLNLTAADYVFILDPWWNPAVEAQAIGRAHRMGQTNKVIAYRMIARGTVEEKILVLQKTKKDLAESIVSEDGDFMKKLTKEDLEMLLD
jgi:SNF2 family DNA or RNA helicase